MSPLEKGDPALGRKMKAEQEKAIRHAVAVKARALSIFEELMKLPEFQRWMEDNIIVRDEIDEATKTITTYVIYKGGQEGDIDGDDKEEDDKDDNNGNPTTT